MGGFFRSSISIWLCFIGLIPLYAQQNQCFSRSIAVNVEATDGTPITNLQAADFRATLARDSVTVANAVYEQGPRRVLILLDVSDSMTDPIGEWDAVLATVKDVTAAFPAHTSPALMIFADGTQLVAGFDESRSTVLTKISGLVNIKSRAIGKFTRHTALLDAISQGLSFLGPPRFGDTMLLFTDGGDNVSMEREQPLQRQVLASGIRIFGVIGFPKIFRSPLPYPLTDRELLRVPDAIAITGGHSVVFRWEQPGKFLDELRGLLRAQLPRLVRNLSESYKLELTLERPVSRFENLRLSVSNGHAEGKRLNVLHQQKLAPCN